jgi:hypothetical protein
MMKGPKEPTGKKNLKYRPNLALIMVVLCIRPLITFSTDIYITVPMPDIVAIFVAWVSSLSVSRVGT